MAKFGDDDDDDDDEQKERGEDRGKQKEGV